MTEVAIAAAVTFLLGIAVGVCGTLFLINKSLNMPSARKILFDRILERASAEEVQAWRGAAKT
jgi:hypothetical protein